MAGGSLAICEELCIENLVTVLVVSVIMALPRPIQRQPAQPGTLVRGDNALAPTFAAAQAAYRAFPGTHDERSYRIMMLSVMNPLGRRSDLNHNSRRFANLPRHIRDL